MNAGARMFSCFGKRGRVLPLMQRASETITGISRFATGFSPHWPRDRMHVPRPRRVPKSRTSTRMRAVIRNLGFPRAQNQNCNLGA